MFIKLFIYLKNSLFSHQTYFTDNFQFGISDLTRNSHSETLVMLRVFDFGEMSVNRVNLKNNSSKIIR